MVLAHMIYKDSDALECDFAETYRIYDMRELPACRAALFACGLGDDSRIKMSLTGVKVSQENLLIASCLDRLSLLLWIQSDDGRKGRNRPESIYDRLAGLRKEKDVKHYSSGSEFDMAWRRAVNGG